MEDAHVIDLNFDKKGTALFGVFDGHGGKEVALFAHHHIVRVLRDKVIPPSEERGHDDSALMTTLFEEMASRGGRGRWGEGSVAVITARPGGRRSVLDLPFLTLFRPLSRSPHRRTGR